MFCPKCGKKLQDNALFCGECGFNVSSIKKNIPSNPVPQEQPAAVEAPIVIDQTVAVEAPIVPEQPAVVDEPIIPEQPAATETPKPDTNNCTAQVQSAQSNSHVSQTMASNSNFSNAQKILSDPLHVIIAILLSVASVIRFFTLGFDIFLVLITIGSWITYVGAVSKKTEVIGTGINLASVSVKIQYVLVYIFAGLIALIGGGIWAILHSFEEVFQEVVYHSREVLVHIVSDFELPSEINREVFIGIDRFCHFLGNSNRFQIGLIVFIVFIIIALLITLFNLLFTHQFASFLSKASRACKEHKPVVINDHRCANWVLAFGILSGVGLISYVPEVNGVLSIIHNGCIVIICILASILMKKDD